ncbi:MAG: sulfatase-like hydrolase/transferase, partial [Bacteroidales bacterium]|nr:sulfatase-like hydrolase/transferase [Bacteroidales bacterium]
VGNMMNKLNELKIEENTIIIFLSDNGFFLGERGMAGKWYAHNESVRIPMFIYQPRLGETQKGLKLHSMALNIDIAPTILDMAGVEAPMAMQGESLLNLINGNAKDWRTAFFYEHRLPNPRIPKSEAYIGEKYKYIHYYELPDSNIEMYNVSKDKLELNNMAYELDYQSSIKTYQSKLDSIKNTAK